jgi:tetratricopeptide (TPR) repeat protein
VTPKPRRTRAASGLDRKSAPPSTPARRERKRPAPARVDLPEDMLRRAMEATTPRGRALWARRGLGTRAPLDTTTHAMLLRQLYLAHYEEGRFARAAAVSEQALALGVLPDVAHQDAARAKQALGDVDGAASHLRLAARLSPPSRKAFHWWTLGSIFYLAGRHNEAIAAMARAARWGTTDKPLYQGHLALAELALGRPVPELGSLIDRLLAVPAGNGYGRFVLGQMAYHDQRWAEAREWLEAFVRRSTSGRKAMAIALRGEIAAALKTLEQIPTG